MNRPDFRGKGLLSASSLIWGQPTKAVLSGKKEFVGMEQVSQQDGGETLKAFKKQLKAR